MDFEPTALKLKPRNVEIKSEPPLPQPRPIMNETASMEPLIPSALTIKPKLIVDDSPKPLEIKKSETPVVYYEQEKKFDLSLAYLKTKVPKITSFVYSQIRAVLDSVDRTNQNKPDTAILEFGKSLQESIAKKTMEASDTKDLEVLNKISISYKTIIDCIEADKKGLLKSILKMFSSDVLSVQDTLTEEVRSNKAYRKYLEEFDKTYIPLQQQLKALRDEMLVYLEVAQVLLDEFTNEGFDVHSDYLNRRIISLVQSKSMVDVSISMVASNIQKGDMYKDNIDNVINILVPTLLTKMKLKNYTDDSSYQELSNQIINKLKDN